jgi:hypothetical protein
MSAALGKLPYLLVIPSAGDTEIRSSSILPAKFAPGG